MQRGKVTIGWIGDHGSIHYLEKMRSMGINRDLVENGVNGFWATTAEDWKEKLSILIEDYTLRERMGREGRERVLERYTLQTCAPRLLSILQKIMDGN